MANFFAELKRRHIYRAGAAYVVVAWALTQLVEILVQVFTLPLWIAQSAIVLLAVGFPVALLVAWTIESKPHQAVVAAVRSKPTIVDWSLFGALVAVMLLLGYQQVAPSSDATTRQAGVDAARSSSLDPTGAISLAVLPFTNLSSDPEQEFFSDGMTEEITAALAKIQKLRVVGRTSAFEFKGQNRDLRAIGQALSATHLIEGSVRKDGNEVRITAQLIKADDGTHLWTESYNRELRGIFALQEDIAQAIAASLRVPLGLQQGETLVRNRTNDTASYEDYLRAKALVRARGLKSLTDAAALLEQVVARDSGYAPAWAVLSLAYALTPAYHPAWASDAVEETRQVVAATLPRAEAAAQRAIELDPRSADGHMSLGALRAYRGELLEAEEPFLKALEIDADNPDALHFYGQALGAVGYLKEAIALRQRLRVLEPFVPIFNWNFAYLLWINGQADDALALLTEVPPGFAFRNLSLASIYASLGRYGDAADTVLTVPAGGFAQGTVEETARLLRTAPNAVASPQTLPRPGLLKYLYLHIGAQSRVLEFYENSVTAGYSSPGAVEEIWHRSYAQVRKTERFKAYVRNAGLVEYWRAKGWPELCRPIGADDFVCD